MKILIADDERGFADLLSEWLSRKGHSVDVAYDGNRALEFLKKQCYDLAFLDFTMPEKTGIELFDQIKTRCPSTRTVIMTGYTLVEDSFTKALGINEHLYKPVKLQDVEEILRKYAL